MSWLNKISAIFRSKPAPDSPAAWFKKLSGPEAKYHRRSFEMWSLDPVNAEAYKRFVAEKAANGQI